LEKPNPLLNNTIAKNPFSLNENEFFGVIFELAKVLLNEP